MARTPGLFFVLVCTALACSGPSGPTSPLGGDGSGAGVGFKDLQRIQQGPEAVRTPDGLFRVDLPQNAQGTLYVKGPRPHLYKYDSMFVDEPHITYAPGTGPRRDADERALRDYFRERVVEALTGDRGWKLTDRPGKGVLLVSVSALDLDLASTQGGAPTVGSTDFVNAGGSAKLVVSLSDSMTGEVLLRFGERRKLPAGQFSGGGSVEMQRMRKVIDAFADDTSDSVVAFYTVAKRIRDDEMSGTN